MVALRPGESLAGGSAASIPRGYWSFSWVAEDDLSFPNDSVPMSGEWGIVSSAQTDGQAETLPSSKHPFVTNWP
ncbi:Ribosomal protein S12 methylthiotransferase RimO [Dissostichus eleginoides]|uniref:Ribosomal protein S12 methylthiotransferase RimO n=1 Tax=Dissostichus eleginoides TaxID=100907 RepID=A0AAD9C211_DISEL|nr:Ribosomal protein S12 methylthiotransferase RimO [Dissostichus eleginoides]